MKTNPFLQEQFDAHCEAYAAPPGPNEDRGLSFHHPLTAFCYENRDNIKFVEDTPDQGTPGIGASEGRLTDKQEMALFNRFDKTKKDWYPNKLYSAGEMLVFARMYAARFEPKWLPIESAPKDVSLHKLNKQLVGWWDDESWVWSRGYYDYGRWWYNTEIEINPTHFLPIPQPPQTEK